jgi:DNA processing protein
MKKTDELESWISLWRVKGIGPKNFQKLLSFFGSPAAVFESNTSKIQQAGISQKLANSIYEQKNADATNADIEWLNASEKHHIITIECPQYPKLLKQISDPPYLLYIHGNLDIINDPQIAIVGSRNPTQSGISSAYEFSKYLSSTGLCITSGLALGVDGMAHQGAIDTNAPTIAVIATGIDRVYPAKHRELAHKIVEKGAIISEFCIGTHPDSRNFPRRNRIISGLSYGTLVVEAAQKSGSLITARLAGEQNREVFAIPGSIHNPLARGCHQLIRQGAKLVETGQDIMEEMASVIEIDSLSNTVITTQLPAIDANQGNSQDELDDEYLQLLDQMGFDPVPIDELVIKTGFTTESISAMLLMLELQNYVASTGSGTYMRLK